MKFRYLPILLIAILYMNNACSQTLTKERAGKLLSAYKRSIRTFANLEICGNPLDGPAFMLKRTESYSLDKLIRITPEQETSLGLKIFREEEASNLVNNDRNLSRIRTIVAKLAASSWKPAINYHVYIIQSDQVNAFSTIGGYIYVTSGLFSLLDTEDELAFVLGHEISHILYSHVTRKIKKITLINNVAEKVDFQQFSAIAQNLNMTLSAPFDQIDEYDADKSSVEIVKKAGYNETGFDSFFRKLERYDRKDLLSRFTSTHPSSANRRKCLNKLIGK